MIKRTLAVMILAAALSACGSSSQTTAPTPATQDPVPVAETTVAQEPTAVSAEATATATLAAAETPASAEVVAEQTTEAPAATAEATTILETLVNTKLNLNEADGEQYQATIPNFGDRMVREFLEYRPYVSIQQFRQEIGKYVDEAQVAEYEKYVYVPVNVNEADAETLQQVPGVDETVAAELIAARPYESNQAFLDKLATQVPGVDLTVAQSYLVSQ